MKQHFLWPIIFCITLNVYAETRQIGVQGKKTGANSIAIDSSRNVYVTGKTGGGLDGNALIGLSDFFITKYNSVGIKQWTKQLGVANKHTQTSGIATDSSNNVYATGMTMGALDGNLLAGEVDDFVTAYSTGGDKKWTKQFGAANADTRGSSITTDSANNIYATGTTTGGLDGKPKSGRQDLFIIKFSPTGVKQWTKQFGIKDVATEAKGITIDAANNIYVTGFMFAMDKKPEGTYYLLVTKYNSDGIKQWIKLLGNKGTVTTGYGIAADSASNVYVTGLTTAALDGNKLSGRQDFFITKFNSNGDRQWTKQLGVAEKFVSAVGVKTDAAGNVYVTGKTGGGLDGNAITGAQDLFVTKYDSSGIKQWTKQFGAAGKTLDTKGIAVDSAGEIYITGWTEVGLEGNTLIGTTDCFLFKINSNQKK